jgi:hypothetical protein
LAAVPVTKMPVTRRLVTPVLSDPSSLWFWIDWIEEIVCVPVTLYVFAADLLTV